MLQAPSSLRSSRRRTLTALAFRRPRTPAGPASRSAPDSALRASRGSNGSQVRRSRYLALRCDQNGATLRVSPEMKAIARELRTGKATAISWGRTSFRGAPQAALAKLARPPVKLQIGPRPRRWTPRPAVSGSPCFPGTGRHSAPFHRRGLGKGRDGRAAPSQGNEVTRRIIDAAPLTGLACRNGCG